MRERAFAAATLITDILSFYVNEKKEAATFLSHGKNQDIGAPLLNAMAKELGLNTRDFVDLAKCPLSTEDFLAAKKERLSNGLRILRRG